MHNHTHQPDTAHDPHRRYLCRHVHTNGNRCGSPALRGHDFCYYHDRTRLPNAPLAGRMGMFKMQPIDDRHAIQIALYDILSRIFAGDVDNKRASILLYGLQIASSNLAHRDKAQTAEAPLEHVTTHLRLGDLAPIQEIIGTEAAEQLTAEQLTTEQLTTAEERHPQPVPSEGVILPLSEVKGKDLSSPAATELDSTPTPSTPPHSEPQAENLSIPEATEPRSLTLAAVQAHTDPNGIANTAGCTNRRQSRSKAIKKREFQSLAGHTEALRVPQTSVFLGSWRGRRDSKPGRLDLMKRQPLLANLDTNPV